MTFANRGPFQVRFTGAGGQGVITAGVILAEAALRDGQHVVQTQSYGPEARLGASKAEVIISSTPVAFPEVSVPDVLVCLSSGAARKYAWQVHSATIVLMDECAEDVESEGIVHRMPLARTAAEAGMKAATNVVGLWVVNAIAGLVNPESLRAALMERLPTRFRAGNEQALAAAQNLVAAAMVETELALPDRNEPVQRTRPAPEARP